MFLARADAPASTFIKGYWTHELLDYPSGEWRDDNGTNADVIGYTGTDKNRPFVISQGDDFSLNAAAFKALGNGALTGNWSVSSDKYSFAGQGSLPGGNNGLYVLELSGINGSAPAMINSETVTLDWNISGDSIRTKHKLYTIGGSLSNSNSFHTLIDLSCGAARNLSNTQKDKIVERIYDLIKTLHLNRIDGEGPLKYWGSETESNEGQHNSVSELLETCDGDCIAWAYAFKQLLSLQGVACTVCELNCNVLSVPQLNGEACRGFLQKPVAVQGEDNAARILALGQSGVAFDMHKIVKYVTSANQTFYYDPGTGGGPYSSWQEYVTNALDFWFGDSAPYDRVPVAFFNNVIQYFTCDEEEQ